MPSARLLLEKWKMCLVEHISPVPPPAHPASEDFSYWPSQGRALNRQWRWRQHWCTDLLLESVHDYHPAFPQASFGMRELEILWRKQRAGDSSPKALQTYVPVLSQFFASFTLPLRTSRSLGGRNQVSSKRLISAQPNAGCHMVCPKSSITCDRLLLLLAQTTGPIILLGFSLLCSANKSCLMSVCLSVSAPWHKVGRIYLLTSGSKCLAPSWYRISHLLMTQHLKKMLFPGWKLTQSATLNIFLNLISL